MNLATHSSEPVLVIDFDDTRLLVPLFGSYDRHLARIEQRLGLSFVPRGNRVAIFGDADAAKIARAALGDLYQRLKNGLEVSAADVDGAVRMAESQPISEPNSSVPARKTQRGKRTRRRTT